MKISVLKAMGRAPAWVVLFGILFVFPGLGTATERGQTAILEQLENAFVTLAEEARPSVVSLSPYVPPSPSVRKPSAPTTRPTNSASGVIFDGKRGLIVTNSHAVRDSEKISIRLLNGLELVGRVVGQDDDTDLAVVQVESETPLPQGRWGDSSKLKVGQMVVAVGNPYGLHDTLTMGIVSGLNRENINLSRYEDFIQTDASINPGNSGGPLLNIRGEIIGINTAIINYAQNIGFAIPSNVVRDVVDQLMQSGRVRRGWLGVGIESVTQEIAEKVRGKAGRGVYVNSVFKGEPAYNAGIREGDVILKVGGAPVDSPNGVIRMVGAIQPGQSVKVDILRGGEMHPLSILLGLKKEHPLLATPSEWTIPSLGIEVDDRKSDLPDDVAAEHRGVLVADVVPKSPAEQGGLKRGDKILAVNGKDVESVGKLQTLIENSLAQKVVELSVTREDRNLVLHLIPGS